MDDDLKRQFDEAIAAAKAKIEADVRASLQAEFDARLPQIRREAQAEALAYFKSLFVV